MYCTDSRSRQNSNAHPRTTRKAPAPRLPLLKFGPAYGFSPLLSWFLSRTALPSSIPTIFPSIPVGSPLRPTTRLSVLPFYLHLCHWIVLCCRNPRVPRKPC
jgi:hypothetical protein